MCARKRLTQEERINEILEASIKLFKEKGFVHTTMEDIVAATSLSKGGLYHYYKNTTDVLHDIMDLGMEYRLDLIRSDTSGIKKGDEAEFMATKIVEKILDDNPYMDIYVQFLIAKKNNGKLEALFQEIKEDSREKLKKELGVLATIFDNENNYNLITNFINAMIMGSETLLVRESFLKNKEALIKMLKALIENLQ